MANLQEYSPKRLYLLYSKYTNGANNSAGGGSFCDSHHSCDKILSEELKMSAEDTFSVVKERIDKFDLSQTHTPEEWQRYSKLPSAAFDLPAFREMLSLIDEPEIIDSN
ncbi:hypothetical protein GC174_17040 [bacterium]|nr:hypothetical protein [bacterium]